MKPSLLDQDERIRLFQKCFNLLTHIVYMCLVEEISKNRNILGRVMTTSPSKNLKKRVTFGTLQFVGIHSEALHLLKTPHHSPSLRTICGLRKPLYAVPRNKKSTLALYAPYFSRTALLWTNCPLPFIHPPTARTPTSVATTSKANWAQQEGLVLSHRSSFP